MTDPRAASSAEQPTSSLALAENVPLWSLLVTVSLFTTGQISHFYELDSLRIVQQEPARPPQRAHPFTKLRQRLCDHRTSNRSAPRGHGIVTSLIG